MRQIKFRGKQITTGNWLYGDLMHDTKNGCYIYPMDTEGLYKENKVIPETIGQFTGLLDKNGNEIWEGDVVITQWSKKPFGVVTWHDCGYFFIDATNGEWKHFGNGFRPLGEIADVFIDNERTQIEVVGNIHDNKLEDFK